MRSWLLALMLLAAVAVAQEETAGGNRFEDKIGNFRIVLPSGWFLVDEHPRKPGVTRRVHAQRLAGEGGRVAVDLEVWSLVNTNIEVFTSRTPGEQLGRIDKASSNWMTRYFGDGSRGLLTPEIDASVSLGGADTSAGFVYRSRTLQEEAKIREAEELIRRGQKGVEIPEYAERELRGRIAMLSPRVYVVRVFLFPGFAEDETLQAEVTALLDSFEFIDDEAYPPPLSTGGKRYGDTRADPANATERQERGVVSDKGRITYRIAAEYTVPVGMATVPEKRRGKSNSVVLVGQDDRNSWVKVVVSHASLMAISDRNKAAKDPRTVIESWRSNWEAKARGARFPKKPDKNIRFGPLKGKGYKKLGGKVGPFPATFQCAVDDKSNWRTSISVETRGNGEKVFRKQLKLFFKSLKFDYDLD